MTEPHDANAQRAAGRLDEPAADGEPVVVRDRRKVDPATGELRNEATAEPVPPVDVPAGSGGPGAGAPAGESTVDDAVAPAPGTGDELAERTADLQRVQAEYANYRRRVERDKEAVVAEAKASVLGDLLPLLDDLERADAHGDLTGAFKAVADKLIGVLEKTGLAPFGVEGEAFDPSVHEAVQHDTSPDVDSPTVTTVLRRGYSVGDRVLRPAMVAVTDHEPAAAASAEVPGDQPIDPPAEGELPVDVDGNPK